MQRYEQEIIANYVHHTSELLKEIRHSAYQWPHMSIPERLGEQANDILTDYADWIKDIRRVIGLEAEQESK